MLAIILFNHMSQKNLQKGKPDTFQIYFTLKQSASHSVVSDSLRPHELYNPWNSPGQNTGVDSGSLLQGIFPT